MESFIPILMIFAFVLVFGLIMKFAIAQEKKLIALLEEHYKAIADKFKLEYNPPQESFWGKKHPFVTGSNNGISYHLHDYKSGGKNKTTYTQVKLVLPNSSTERRKFSISKEGPFRGLGKMLGMQDIQLEVADIDTKYVFKSNDEEWFKSLMDDVLLSILSEINVDMKSSFHLKDNVLHYTFVGICRTPQTREEIERISLFLFKIAQKVSA